MKAHRFRLSGMAAVLFTMIGAGEIPAASQTVIQAKFTMSHEVSFQGATPREEALVRTQIQSMHPDVIPLRIIFVPHWKYVDAARIFQLRVPAGYTSAMFTHLPSRTVFIDVDRYINDDSLGYWLAHELGHLATNSVKEADAERAAKGYRRSLKVGPETKMGTNGQISGHDGQKMSFRAN